MTVHGLKTATLASVTTRGHTATRDDVLTAIALCDELGKDEFLDQYDYRDSVRYHLRHNGRSYPSKAILGVALGLDNDNFFGGVRETVCFLGRLGFHVRNSQTGEIVDELGLDFIRKAMIEAGFDDPVPEWPTLPITPSAYFAAGTNRPGEIAALGKVGADVGVTAPELSQAAEDELHKLAGSDVLVFIDSGAFSEVKFTDAGVEVVKPISDVDWRELLALYKRLARSLGSSLYCVAPDRVGSQDITLARLARYRDEIREIYELGARVLVALQKGDLSHSGFASQVDETLGFTGWTPAMPCRKAATSPAEVHVFVRKRAPRHVHLLGLGISNRRASDYIEPFVCSTSSVSMDSCWIAANVGRNKRADGSVRVRRYTKARDIADVVLRALGRFSKRLKVELALYSCFAAPVPTEKA